MLKTSFARGDFSISPGELRSKGLVGEIMWDIIWCDSDNCKSKEAFLELVEETANEIIVKVEKKG